MRRVPSARPRYVPRPAKAVEVILWLAGHLPGIDVYHLVKAVYFADRRHVAAHGRPVVGDDYAAAPFGPLPTVIYGLLKGEPIEVLAAGVNGRLPFTVDPLTFRVTPEREANPRLLSDSDREALAHGIDMVRDRTFDELVALTHSDPAFANAEGGRMDYRDFVPDDDPDRDAKRDDLSETARFAVL